MGDFCKKINTINGYDLLKLMKINYWVKNSGSDNLVNFAACIS